MRILILTQPLDTNNYGGILQAYALQTVLKQMGHEVVTDRYGYKPKLPLLKRILHFIYHFIKFYFLRDYRYYPYRYCFKRFNKEKQFMESISHELNRFIENRMTTIRFITDNQKKLHKKVQEFDAVIVGSDQVWRQSMSNISIYYLNFTSGIDIKRIAYAASFGLDNLNEYSDVDLNNAISGIKQFNAVSVREKSGVYLCSHCFHIKAHLVLDPTLLLTKEYYQSLAIKERPVSGKRLITYILDKNYTVSNYIDLVSEYLHLNCFEIGPLEHYKNLIESDAEKCKYPSIETWLSMFESAEFVVTDSFHGTVYSIIFNKPFIVITNPRRGIERLSSLLQMVNLQNRLIDDISTLNTNLITQEIDWQSVNSIIDTMRNESVSFLLNSLNN